MIWLVAGAVAWIVLAVPVAVVIGRSIAHADERAERPDFRRPAR